MRQIIGGTPAAKSRRNLTRTADRAMWEEARKEDHPLRYRLHGADVAYNIKCDRLGLLAEIREAKPLRIERLPPRGEERRYATAVEHLKFMGEMEVLEVQGDDRAQ